MDRRPDNRRNHRIKTRFETLVAAGPAHGAGLLADISYSGALLEKTSLQPEIGTEVCLFVFLQPINPLELNGRVVRHTEDGFAVEYKTEDSEIRRLVDDAAALVAAPPRSR